jgi:hypothetical protein
MVSLEDGATITGSSLSQFENKPDTITHLPEVASTLAGFLDCPFPNAYQYDCTVLNVPKYTMYLAHFKKAVGDTEQFALFRRSWFLNI